MKWLNVAVKLLLLILLEVKCPFQLRSEAPKVKLNRMAIFRDTGVVQSQCDVSIDICDFVMGAGVPYKKGAKMPERKRMANLDGREQKITMGGTMVLLAPNVS